MRTSSEYSHAFVTRFRILGNLSAFFLSWSFEAYIWPQSPYFLQPVAEMVFLQIPYIALILMSIQWLISGAITSLLYCGKKLSSNVCLDHEKLPLIGSFDV